MESDTWLILLDKAIIPVVLAIITPLLYLLARKLIDIFEKKTNIDVSKEHEAMLEKLIGRGIAYAEEQARKATKTDGEVPDGDSKLEMAIDFISKNAETLGLDAKADDLAKMVEAKLFEDRPADAEPSDS